MKEQLCRNCGKGMNGGVYKQPDRCPHCMTLQTEPEEAPVAKKIEQPELVEDLQDAALEMAENQAEDKEQETVAETEKLELSLEPMADEQTEQEEKNTTGSAFTKVFGAVKKIAKPAKANKAAKQKQQERVEPEVAALDVVKFDEPIVRSSLPATDDYVVQEIDIKKPAVASGSGGGHVASKLSSGKPIKSTAKRIRPVKTPTNDGVVAASKPKPVDEKIEQQPVAAVQAKVETQNIVVEAQNVEAKPAEPVLNELEQFEAEVAAMAEAERLMSEAETTKNQAIEEAKAAAEAVIKARRKAAHAEKAELKALSGAKADVEAAVAKERQIAHTLRAEIKQLEKLKKEMAAQLEEQKAAVEQIKSEYEFTLQLKSEAEEATRDEFARAEEVKAEAKKAQAIADGAKVQLAATESRMAELECEYETLTLLKTEMTESEPEPEASAPVAKTGEYDAIFLTSESNGQTGMDIVKRQGLISAEHILDMSTVQESVDAAKDFNLGESRNTPNVVQEARKTVLDRLKQEAFTVGADAVIGVNIAFNPISAGQQNYLMVMASGTAVTTKSAVETLS